LALLAVVGAALAFDCEHLQEPERTACLDKAADENVAMFPVPDHAYRAAAPDMAAVDPYGEDEDGTNDIMGDLGEGATTRATMSTEAAAQRDLRVAEATSQGMYSDDVKVARAFSDLTDEMDDLRTHMNELHTRTLVAATQAHASKVFNGRATEHNDLGESASPVSAEPEESMGVLDLNTDQITKDLTPHISHEAPKQGTDADVDALLKSMDDTMHQHKAESNPLDSAPNFLQVDESVVSQKLGDMKDDGMMDDLVQQDFAASGASLMGRAQLEATQYDQMNQDNYDEMQADADDLGDAADIGEQQGASLDVISKTLVQHPDLDQASSAGAEEAAMVVSEDEAKNLGEVSQDNAVNRAASFANDEDRKEEEIIKRAQAREKENEERARRDMYKDMKTMNKLNDMVNADVGPASNPNMK
jgi:hypothetical protein